MVQFKLVDRKARAPAWSLKEGNISVAVWPESTSRGPFIKLDKFWKVETGYAHSGMYLFPSELARIEKLIQKIRAKYPDFLKEECGNGAGKQNPC